MDVLYKAPKSYLLTDAKITVGRAYMMLKDTKLSMFAEQASTIVIEYFSMANLVYKDTYKDLDKWFKEHHLKDLRKILKKRRLKFEMVEPVKVRRHNTVVKQAKATTGASWRTTTAYKNSTWYCSGSNRIYTVTVYSSLKRPLFFKRKIDDKTYKDLINQILSSFKCH
jgi:hypothetical protein